MEAGAGRGEGTVWPRFPDSWLAFPHLSAREKPVHADLIHAKHLAGCLARNGLFNRSLAVAETESVFILISQRTARPERTEFLKN